MKVEHKQIIDIIVDIMRSNIIVRERWSPSHELQILESNIVAVSHLAQSMLDYIKTEEKVYHYFDKKYRKQFDLNPQLMGDILICKYPDNTLNILLKSYL